MARGNQGLCLAAGLAVAWFSAAKLHRPGSAAPVLKQVASSERIVSDDAGSDEAGSFRPPAAVQAVHKTGCYVYSLTFAPSGRELVAGESSETIVRWRLGASGNLTHLSELKVPGSSHAISPNASLVGCVLVESRDAKSIRLWSLNDKREIRRFEGFAQKSHCLAFSPDNKVLAATRENDLIFWDVASGRPFHLLQGHQEKVRSVAFSPNGKLLASAASEEWGCLWDVQSGKLVRRFTAGKGTYSANLAFSPDGQAIALAVGGINSNVRLMDINTDKEIKRFTVHSIDYHGSCIDPCFHIAFSPDGRRLIAWGEMHGGTIYQWEIVTGKKLWSLEDESGVAPRTCAAAFSPCSTRLASASWSGGQTTVVVWNMLESGTVGMSIPSRLDNHRLNQLWTDLASEDAERGWGAIGALVRAPGQAIPFLKRRMKPTLAVDSSKVLSLVRQLDSPQFFARKEALEQLEGLGEAVAPVLREVIAQKPSLEVRQRCEEVLRFMEGPLQGDRLRHYRALAALEYIGTSEARQLLTEIATGEPAVRLTQEAQAALRRLER